VVFNLFCTTTHHSALCTICDLSRPVVLKVLFIFPPCIRWENKHCQFLPTKIIKMIAKISWYLDVVPDVLKIYLRDKILPKNNFTKCWTYSYINLGFFIHSFSSPILPWNKFKKFSPRNRNSSLGEPSGTCLRTTDLDSPRACLVLIRRWRFCARDVIQIYMNSPLYLLTSHHAVFIK